MTSSLLSVSNLTHVYEDGTVALENISLGISKGERIGLIGENGSGKTTLCKHLNALLTPSKGAVFLEGRRIDEMAVADLVKKVGFLFQNPDNQLFRGTVAEEISFGLQNLGLDEKEIGARSRKYIQRLGLERYAKTPPLILSMGLRRLVTIASILAMEQDIILLDEPTAWLDGFQAKFAIDAIRDFAETGRTIFVVSHNIKLIAELTERCIVISRGRKVADGGTREILGNAELLRGAGLLPTPVFELASRLGIDDRERIITVDDLTGAFRAGEIRRSYDVD